MSARWTGDSAPQTPGGAGQSAGRCRDVTASRTARRAIRDSFLLAALAVACVVAVVLVATQVHS